MGILKIFYFQVFLSCRYLVTKVKGTAVLIKPGATVFSSLILHMEFAICLVVRHFGKCDITTHHYLLLNYRNPRYAVISKARYKEQRFFTWEGSEMAIKLCIPEVGVCNSQLIKPSLSIFLKEIIAFLWQKTMGK